VIRVVAKRPAAFEPGECALPKGCHLSIEMPAAIAVLPADASVDADAQERHRELMARITSVLFATGAVFFASLMAVLIQLQ
jgi:hypothetical protein